MPAKQYEIVHQIGEVSVTVRAPSAAECEQIVESLGKSPVSPMPAPGSHEASVVDVLRNLADGVANKSAYLMDISSDSFGFGGTKYKAHVTGIHGSAEIRWVRP